MMGDFFMKKDLHWLTLQMKVDKLLREERRKAQEKEKLMHGSAFSSK